MDGARRAGRLVVVVVVVVRPALKKTAAGGTRPTDWVFRVCRCPRLVERSITKAASQKHWLAAPEGK